MGFGYLLIGYLVTFLLHLTVDALGFGGFALLLGYGLMFYGLSELNRYQKAFAAARWLLVPLLISAAYEALANLDALFLWKLPIVNPTVNTVYDWTVFVLLFLFNISMLYGIRAIAKDVELPRVEIAAIRNAIFVFIYVVLHLVGNLPIPNLEAIRNYLTLPLLLVQFAWILCNLFLLLSCNKNICPASDVEQTPKRYRWDVLNKIGDTYEANRQRSIERTTREVEEKLRRRKEKREEKKIKHNKKK